LLPIGDAANAANADHADNAIPINASIWSGTAATLTPTDPSYALYRTSVDPCAQHIIDQYSLHAWQLGY
jgi:hypothetical protein